MSAVFVVLAVIFGLLFVVSATGLVVVSVFALRYGRMVLHWEDSIDEALDRLDASYRIMSDIQQRPTFVDTPEVRQLKNEIEACRETVLWIANSMSSVDRSPRLGNRLD